MIRYLYEGSGVPSRDSWPLITDGLMESVKVRRAKSVPRAPRPSSRNPELKPTTRSSPSSCASSTSLAWARSEEHTSELQSRGHLVCRLLLEKKQTTSPIKLTSAQHTLDS